MNVLVCALLAALCLGHAVSDCPSHWESDGLKCYFFSHDTETWSAAMTTCHFFSSHLAEIRTEDDNKFLTKHVGARGTHKYWIGAADILNEGEWVWYNSRTVLDNSTYENWQPNGKDNANGNENCAQILQSGEWADAQCDQSDYYICERSLDHVGEIFG